MEREEVEEQIDAVLGKPNTYSPYGNNLRGGTVQYRDGIWVLEVVYKAGAPAPWVQNEDGTAQHYPPVDETIMEYKINKIPKNTK